MSTRSYVGTIEENAIRFIYVHYDGYLAGVGRALKLAFPTLGDIKPIIDLGDRSQLTCETEPGDGGSYAEQGEDFAPNAPTLFPFGQDNKDETIKKLIRESKKGGIEYLYLLDNGTWRAWDIYKETSKEKISLNDSCLTDLTDRVMNLIQA